MLRLVNSKIVLMVKFHFYARMTDKMMENNLPIVELSFPRVVACEFRNILSQEGFSAERVANATSDYDNSTCTVKRDEEDDECIEIDDAIIFSFDESS